MLRLKNIKRTNNIISCEFIPEDCEELIMLEFDLVSLEYSCELPKDYDYCRSYIDYALVWLRVNQNALPDSKTFMWG